MNRDDLIQEACRMCFSPQAANAYDRVREQLAAAVTAELTGRQDLEELIGTGNTEAMTLNHQNHGQFIAAQLTHFQPQVLVETVAWVLRSYQSHGFHKDYWPVQLNSWCRHIEAMLPEEAPDILPLYHYLMEYLEEFDRLPAP